MSLQTVLVNNWDFKGSFEAVWSQSCKREDKAPRKNRIEPVDDGDLRPNPIGGVKLNTISFSVPTNTTIIHIDTFF